MVEVTRGNACHMYPLMFPSWEGTKPRQHHDWHLSHARVICEVLTSIRSSEHQCRTWKRQHWAPGWVLKFLQGLSCSQLWCLSEVTPETHVWQTNLPLFRNVNYLSSPFALSQILYWFEPKRSWLAPLFSYSWQPVRRATSQKLRIEDFLLF